jgi:hypothetical protein
MYRLTKILFLCALIFGAGWLSTTDFEQQRLSQNEYPKDKDNDGVHDYECECGDCFEELYTDTLNN